MEESDLFSWAGINQVFPASTKAQLSVLQHLYNNFPIPGPENIDLRSGFFKPADNKPLPRSQPSLLGLQLHPNDPLPNQSQVRLARGIVLGVPGCSYNVPSQFLRQPPNSGL